MSDLCKLKALLDEFGVQYKLREYADGTIYITCEEGDEKVSGYPDFFTGFNFSVDGKFVDMGAWE